MGLILRSGRSPEVGNGNPLQYSCLENFMGRGIWWATIDGVAESQTQLKRLSSSKYSIMGFPGGTAVKNMPANAEDTRDVGLIPGLGRSPGEGNGNPLQYFLPGKFHAQKILAGHLNHQGILTQCHKKIHE